MTVTFETIVDGILKLDDRYPREAYYFVREALDHTQQKIHKGIKSQSLKQDRHVTGQQLLEGIREFILKAFGPMSFFVLDEWNIRRCEDFGEVVFNLVENGQGMFGKTDEDSRDDFKGGYDFDEAFRTPFLPNRQKPRPALESKHG